MDELNMDYRTEMTDNKAIKGISLVLSDAGDILFDTRASSNRNISALTQLLREQGLTIGGITIKGTQIDDAFIHQLYKPYKILAHTEITEQESISMFLSSVSQHATYDAYSAILASIPDTPRSLFPEVTQCLEQLHSMGMPFVVVSDTAKTSRESLDSLTTMIADQRLSRGLASRFSIGAYITGVVTSKDMGVKKPDEMIFRYAIDSVFPALPYNETIFIAHESKEIFGAADIGMNVIAFNYQAEKDAQAIADEIASRSERFIMEIEKGKKQWIRSVDGLSQIPSLISLGSKGG
jgi:FMN phosphatase YigB (HAD superfamily)